MMETRGPGTKHTGLWKNLTTGILNKINKKKISNNQNDTARDMGNTYTPVSRLDLSGMNREQAKELIGKIIDEKLEMISNIELAELKIDHSEREKQRAKAAERINERRNRRKCQSKAPAETIVDEHGVYSDFKQSSVFDVIQPEAFPFEESKSAPIKGQLSIIDALAKAEAEAEPSVTTEFASSFEFKTENKAEEEDKNSGFDFFGLLKYDLDKEGVKQEEEAAAAAPENIAVSTSMDEAVDKVFAFFEISRAKARRFCQGIHLRSVELLKGKAGPAAVLERMKGKAAPLLQKAESRLQLWNKTSALLTALAKRERKVSDRMGLFVDFMDRRNDAFLLGLAALAERVCRLVNLTRDWCERHRKKLLAGFCAGVAVAAAITIAIGNMTAYEYIYNGKVLGVVKNQEDVYKTIDIIGDKLSVQYEADITIDKEKDIRFNKIVAYNQDIDNREDILNRLTYMRDMKANGKGIYVEGKLVAVLESDDAAKEILGAIKNTYLKQESSIEYAKVGFAEDVIIRDVETKLGSIETRDKALEYMMTGAMEKKIHLVQSGETFSEIAKMYGLKQSELKLSNPDVIPEKLSIGQEICLNQIVPLVTVQTTEVARYIEEIPFEIEYENTANLFKKEQTVKSRGVSGEKDVVAEIVRNNGIEVSRREISAIVLSEPTAQVVLVGTKDPPPLIGTGTFIYPIRGKLTSRYGMRWGRLHSGIDLAAPVGTPIKAADGGKVTFAGYNGALGYMVAIDHGGGRVTWYGHCSKLLVKRGDKVYQGQHIANVGNTGRSTGPHVHFEVHVNGKTKNPLNYL